MVRRRRPDAGGDKRGRQSAALYAVAPGAGYDHCRVLDDLRVDDHPDATQELARPFDLHDLYFRERRLTITKPFDPQGSP